MWEGRPGFDVTDLTHSKESITTRDAASWEDALALLNDLTFKGGRVTDVAKTAGVEETDNDYLFKHYSYVQGIFGIRYDHDVQLASVPKKAGGKIEFGLIAGETKKAFR